MLISAADMSGSLLIPLMALLASSDAFRLGLSQHVIPLSPPLAHLFQDEGSAQPHFFQELVRIKRHSVQELMQARPHLVHDMGWSKIQETSQSQAKMDSANSSHLKPPPSVSQDAAVDEDLDVEDEIEHMGHLVVAKDTESYRGHPEITDPDKELFSGPRAADASLEASGFYGRDLKDRDRGDEGGEDEWEGETGEDKGRRGGDARGEEEKRGGGGTGDGLDDNHTTPDLETLIGYSPSFHPSYSQQPNISSPAEVDDSGLQEHHASHVPEVGYSERELWEAEVDKDGNSSGSGVLKSSITPSSTMSTATPTSSASDAGGTANPETETGTDFGFLGSYTKADETKDEETELEDEEDESGLTLKGIFTQNPTVPTVAMAPSREALQPSLEEEKELEEEEDEFKKVRVNDRSEEVEETWGKMEEKETGISHIIPLTTDPSTNNFSRDWLEKTTSQTAQRSEVRAGGIPEALLPNMNVDEMEEARQVMCLDWIELAGRGYVILNMTQNFNCEEFRVDQGVRLLKIMEQVFARRMNSPEGSWVLYLSKPTHQQHQLLMNVASEHGVIDTKDVLGMLGKIRTSLHEMGIQNYSAASSCQSRPSQTRSDYSKLFVVLVIIGSVCMVIITSGFIYICWQRRLPATKTTFRAEELHFVENGCHDNPILDVANDSQPELQEKKPSTNGLSGDGQGGREGNNCWQAFDNEAVTDEEEEEQDTHL